MSLPGWPASIPYQSLRSAWGGMPARAPLATDMEDGNTRQRSQTGSDVGTYSWGGILTAAQIAAFQTFFLVTLDNGARRFRMFVSRDGVTHEERPVQIVAGSLKYAAAGGPNTLVQFSILVFPASLLGVSS